MKRKSNPIGKTAYKPMIYIYIPFLIFLMGKILTCHHEPSVFGKLFVLPIYTHYKHCVIILFVYIYEH